MNYFLAFLPLLAGSGSAALRGLPLPGTLRIASRAEASYSAVGPAYATGFIPATRRRIFTAGWLSPRLSAISLIVIPVMLLISVKLPKNFSYVNALLCNFRYGFSKEKIIIYTNIINNNIQLFTITLTKIADFRNLHNIYTGNIIKIHIKSIEFRKFIFDKIYRK